MAEYTKGGAKNPITYTNKKKKYQKQYNITSKNIKPIIRKALTTSSETKMKHFSGNAFALTGGALVELTGINQGLDIDNRIGNTIHPVYITARILCEMGSTVHKIRCSIFKQIGTSEPTAGFLGVTLDQSYDHNNFYPLFDKCLTQVSTTEKRAASWSFKQSLRYNGSPMKTEYNGTTTTSCIKGRIYFWIRADNADATSYWYNINLYYKDP